MAESDRPCCIIMVGLPCSGKTTVREELYVEYHAASSDDILEKLCEIDGISYSKGFKKHINEAGKIMKASLKKALLEGQEVFIDQTNLSAGKRKGLLGIIHRYGKLHNYETLAVELRATREVLEERNKLRAEKTGKYIPEEVFTNMINSYVEVGEDEGFDDVIVVDNNEQRG